jgi:hypothetical protein
MRAAVRTPRFWPGLAATFVGGWWVTHDQTAKYVFGLLFLTAGLVILATVFLAPVRVLRRSLAALGIGAVTLAVGIVAPIVRADLQMASEWTSDISGTNRFLLDDAILVVPDHLDGDPSGLVAALDPRDGHLIRMIGKTREGSGETRFTRAGDFVHVSSGPPGPAKEIVDYYTYSDGLVWSHEFASPRGTDVQVIAADERRAAVRTCRWGEDPNEPVCEVEGIGPDGQTAWTRPLQPVYNHDRPEDRLTSAVMGTSPTTYGRFQRLDLRDGSVLEQGSGRFGGKRASEFAEQYEPLFPGMVRDDGLVSDVEGVEIGLDGETLTGRRDGQLVWRLRIKEAFLARVANGGIAVLSEPVGWSPFLPWRTVNATKVSVIRPSDGTVTATAVVPYSPRAYPLSDHAALVTGAENGVGSGPDRDEVAGADEQRLIGRL